MTSEWTTPRKRRAVALRVAAAALALAAITPTAAQAAPAETAGTQAVAIAGPVGYHFTGYYPRKSQCEDRGRDGVGRGEWLGYVCINGSWIPGDDYELWVRYW
ncbi:hypothetical protein ACFOWZ_33615 [Lentzea rhizosphaerae]|uniref:Secreted protein n=1 Tax=Lentzea rhizosphaerae TaxID=2041025 RepID=A0ABV8C3H4_9PSEU